MALASDAVRITNFEIRAQVGGRALYRITDDRGERYATYDMWMASLCQKAYESKTPVHLHSRAGWYYRDLTFVKLMEPGEAA